jgi:hypothetical protein
MKHTQKTVEPLHGNLHQTSKVFAKHPAGAKYRAPTLTTQQDEAAGTTLETVPAEIGFSSIPYP